jgi:hypothetical protein
MSNFEELDWWDKYIYGFIKAKVSYGDEKSKLPDIFWQKSRKSNFNKISETAHEVHRNVHLWSSESKLYYC